MKSNVTLEEALLSLKEFPEGCSVVSKNGTPEYATDLNLSFNAAKRYGNANGYTFNLIQREDEMYTASFGDFWDHNYITGDNPAYITCLLILKFAGKI